MFDTHRIYFAAERIENGVVDSRLLVKFNCRKLTFSFSPINGDINSQKIKVIDFNGKIAVLSCDESQENR